MSDQPTSRATDPDGPTTTHAAAADASPPAPHADAPDVPPPAGLGGSRQSDRPTPDDRTPSLRLAMVGSMVLTLLVMGVLFPNLWYGMHEITDLPVYWEYASRMAAGETPYTPSFEVEYPPLALSLFRVPGNTHHETVYGVAFNIFMGAVALASAAVTALVACRLWPHGGRAYVAAVLFPVGVALIGTIVINRYDIAVALLLAIFVLCLTAGWHTAAGFVIGVGFALKFTPAALLPLVLLLAGSPRRSLWPLAAFGAAAAAPFVPYLARSPEGVWYTFQYHLERPLQIESVLGTPQLLGQLLGADWATWTWSHGSHSLVAPGAEMAAAVSGGLTLLAVAAVYLGAWLTRRHLRRTPADQVLVVLALLLALMTFGKVLSPQYFIWILPAWALVAARDRWLALLGGGALALTHAEFPSRYWNLLEMEAAPLAIVVARNTLLAAAFAIALWRLWRMPAGAPDETAAASSAASPVAGART